MHKEESVDHPLHRHKTGAEEVLPNETAAVTLVRRATHSVTNAPA